MTLHPATVLLLAAVSAGLGALAALPERRRLRRRVEDLERAGEVERLKKTFVASVTHELRSPLAAIEGCARELLDRAGLGLEERRSLRRVEANARRLSHFVTNVLDLARLERGRLEYSPRLADPGELAADTVRFFEAKAREEGLALTAQIEPGLPPVRLDPDLVTHVLTNLVSNALKFTRPGGEIRVSARRSARHIALTVADTGIGIRDQDLGRIFSPFERVPNPLRRSGAGLGLAISRQIADLHDGTLAATSQPGRGSRFELLLPIRT